MRAEENLNNVTNMVKENKKAYKKRFKQLVNKVTKLSRNTKSRDPDKKKKFSEYPKHHQARVQKQLKEQCQTTLSFLDQCDYAPSQIELYNHDTGIVESFTSIKDDEFQPNYETNKEISEADMDKMNMWLHLKDTFNISNEAWHEIFMASDDPPSLNKMIKHMGKLNQRWNLKPTPGKEGVQVSYRETIVEHIKRLRASGIIKDGAMIKVKMSGDGTNIGKQISVVNITFPILYEKKLAMSERGNYILAVPQTSENYDTLAESL